ncbi:hypothetical protein GCM10009623_17570 [Nocardioides aestuarii]|uniref:Lysylphosphatidylglycerol synthase domain-containing protein n=1 Tax=Nocardioides aestuarii TaxID=252231 RepID=A0ABW4TKD1_9ACTN
MRAPSPRAVAVGRSLAGGAFLAAVVWRVGPRPFVEGLRSIEPTTLLAAGLLTGLATAACAWRWALVSRCVDVGVAFPTALRACYLAQLLNLVVPGGVAGDVHRGWRHGSATGRRLRSLGSVVGERSAGQLVQVVLLASALVLLPSPVPRTTVAVVAGLTTVGLVAVVALGLRPSTRAVVDRRVVVGVVAASAAATTAHVATLVLAARGVGVGLPLDRLVPLALLVLVVAALPLNVAGWGPREGMAVWAFAAGGPGAAAGVATATAYGVLVLLVHVPALALLPRRERPALLTEGATSG